MAELSVTLGSELPPLMVMTAEPSEPTLYDVGEGVMDTIDVLVGLDHVGVERVEGDGGRGGACAAASRRGARGCSRFPTPHFPRS